jgi:hypothetical protein
MPRKPKPRPTEPRPTKSRAAEQDRATPGAGDTPLPPRLRQARAALQRIARGESPTAEELATAPKLEFWCIVVDQPYPVLQGVVTGHPHLADGALIATSPLLWLADDRSAARTVSRFYRLGVPLTEAPRLSN